MEPQAQKTGGAATPGASGGSSGMAPNVASLLCYLCGWLTGLIFLLIEKDNRDVKFHAIQSIGLNIAMLVLWIPLAIVIGILTAISPKVGGGIGLVLYFLFGLGMLGLWILLMVKAYQGQRFKLPLIGNFAEKQVAN